MAFSSSSSSTCTCVDSILDRVQLHSHDYLWDYYDVNQLKLELRLVRTFLLCARRWNNNRDNLSLVSSLSRLEYSVQEIVQEYYPVFLRPDDEFCCCELSDVSCDFLLKIQNNVKLEINELYSKLSCCFSSSVKDGLIEFINSLIENLADFVVWGEVYYNSTFDTLIEPLQERLIFLKNLIGFVVLRGVEQSQLEHLFIHCEAVVVNAARISYTCWFFRDDENLVEQMQFEISKLLEKIKPVGTQIGETYIQVLNASSLLGSSRNLISEMNKHTLGDFVDSLLSCLWDELVNNESSLMVSEKERMKIFLDGLRFLKTILKRQQEKFDGLDEKAKNLVGFLVSEAGILVLTLSANKMNEGLSKEMDIALSELLEKINLFKVELQKKYPVASISMFPRTNELGFMNSFLENLKEVASSEVNAIPFGKERLQIVLELFVSLKTFLENILERRNQHEKFQALWSRVIEVAYKTEFVIDSLIVGGIPDPSPLLFNTIIEEIKMIKTEVLEIDGNKYDFEFQRTAKHSSHLQSRGGIPKINDVVVGLDDEARIIIDQLGRGSIQLDIVSIVGMPGLGKTTLAKKVYNDPSIMCHFHICAWCCVSQVYRMKDLLLEILYCIVPKASDQYSEMNEDDLAGKLYRHLKGNRYLIVLDDLWDNRALDSLGRSFPNDANSSRILLTTRLHKLALEIKPNGNSYPLRRLTDDESYELLKKKLSVKEGYPIALNSLGMQIAKNCNGLPLSVVIIAGILATLDQDAWKEVADKLSSKIVCSTEECKYILELSYEHLPDYLKSCLLYFGAFREDQEIPTWRLTWLWIAEGFVQKTKLKRLEDVAEDYLMDLIGRSLVMIGKQKSAGGVKTCRIHDLLYEFCVSKAEEENFLCLLRGYDELCTFNEPLNLKRLCVYSKREHLEKSRLFCPSIRCLLFFTHGEGYALRRFNISYIFRFFKLLKVLDMLDIELGDIFPSEIALLIHLRYLAIRGMMESIPPSIENLSNLETFLVEAYSGSVLLPDTIWNMQKLRHLHVIGGFCHLSLTAYNLERSPHLCSLDSFSTLVISCGQHAETIIRKFPNIGRLKCRFMKSEEFIGDYNRVVAMNFLSRLESLKLFLYDAKDYQIELSFPLNLKKLTLSDFSWSIMSKLGKLPNLEVLKLLDDVYDGEIWDIKENEFPKLRMLKLESSTIVRWTGSGDHFPRLQKLVLQGCQKLKEVPSCLGYISTLEMIKVCWCSDYVASIVKEIEEEQSNTGNEDFKIHIVNY